MNSKPMSLAVRDALNRVNTRSWYAFGASLAIGFLAHGFVMANRIMYHDDAISIFGLGSTLGSERYTLELLRRGIQLFSHNTSTAWFNGIVSLLFLSIFAAMVVDLLDVQSNLNAVLIAGVLVAFPSIASVFAYMFTAPAYFLALPIIVLGTVLAGKKKPLYIVLGAMCLAFALGDYQAYSAIYAVLVLLLLLKLIFDESKTIKEFGLVFVSYAVTFVLGVVMYMVANKVLLYFTGADNKYESKNLSMLPSAIVDAYTAFVQAFYTDTIGTAPYRLTRWSYCILLVVALVLFAKLFVANTKGQPLRKLLALVLLMLFPVAMNLVYVLTLESVEIHSLMVYGIVFIVIIPIVFYEWISNRTESEKNIKIINIISWILTIAVGCNIFMSCKADNVAYQSAYFSQKEAETYYTTLISRMQQLDGYEANMPVAFIHLKNLNDVNMPDNAEFQVSLTMLESGMQDVTSDYAYKGFMKYQCGFAPNWASETTVQQLQQTPDVQKMGNYPNADSMAIVDGMVVVKFADSDEE